jgi:chromosomal replication initiation ATPase DnaA
MDKKDLDNLKKICKDLRRRVGRIEQTIVRKNSIHPIKIRFDEDEDLIDVVQKVTCELWDVTLEQLLSKRRGRHLVNARISAVHLAYMDYGLGNTSEIGSRFGGRDHSTISREVESADDLLAINDLAFCEPHYRAKSTLDVRFDSIKNNGHPINYQI